MVTLTNEEAIEFYDNQILKLKSELKDKQDKFNDYKLENKEKIELVKEKKENIQKNIKISDLESKIKDEKDSNKKKKLEDKLKELKNPQPKTKDL